MKYALFEFINEKSCEIGETRWIVREDHATFENTSWDTEKEIMVTWPTEFNKLSKKIIKSSIDPSSVSTTTFVAKVLKFSGKFPVYVCKIVIVYLNSNCPLIFDKCVHVRAMMNIINSQVLQDCKRLSTITDWSLSGT